MMGQEVERWEGQAAMFRAKLCLYSEAQSRLLDISEASMDNTVAWFLDNGEYWQCPRLVCECLLTIAEVKPSLCHYLRMVGSEVGVDWDSLRVLCDRRWSPWGLWNPRAGASARGWAGGSISELIAVIARDDVAAIGPLVLATTDLSKVRVQTGALPQSFPLEALKDSQTGCVELSVLDIAVGFGGKKCFGI
jgi:hypothetical protein